MKRILLFIAVVAWVNQLTSQSDPNIVSWQLNTTGQLGYYESFGGPPWNGPTSSVNMHDSVGVLSVCYNTNYVFIRTNSLGYHNMGPWTNPNVPSSQDIVYRFPINPVEETGTKTPQSPTGSLGFGVDGVSLYGISDARSYDGANNNGPGLGIWNTNAWVTEGETMDAIGNGHPQQQGVYHYHANPVQLYDDPASVHSEILGWAYDGFPIYGPFGYDDPMDANSGVVRIESGYSIRVMNDRSTLPDGTVLSSGQQGPSLNAYALGTYIEDHEYIAGQGHLDEYNGRFCITPDFPNGTYAYFATTEANGDPAFPYLIGLDFYGEVPSNSTINNVPGNATCWDGTITTTAPSVTSQPSNQSGCEGDDISFSITYSGTADSVRWHVSTNGTVWNAMYDGNGVQGAASNTLTIGSVANGLDGNDYACYLYHDGGTIVVSNSAEITVTQYPNVTLDNFAQATICTIDAPIALPAGTPAGGSYSGNGVNGNNFDPGSAGVGTQTITYAYADNGCEATATSSIVVETCMGVSELVGVIDIFPNPASDVLTVQWQNELQSIEIFDVKGQRVWSSIVEGTNRIEINLSSFEQGIYFLNVNGNKYLNRKIVKL